MIHTVILHGWGIGSKSWSKVKELLESKGEKVFIPDLPGFGETATLDRPWLIDDYVNWVGEYIKSISEPFFLVGHSFGGGLSAVFASRFPEKIKKLILVDPAIIRVKNPKRELLAKIAKIIKIFSFLPFYQLIRKVFYKFIASDYPGLEGAMRETYLNVVKKDLSYCLSDISSPTLLIWGKKDKITPLKDGFKIKEKISGAKLELINDVGHRPHFETPEILSEKIIKFLENRSPRN